VGCPGGEGRQSAKGEVVEETVNASSVHRAEVTNKIFFLDARITLSGLEITLNPD
jgi:hypothetical protein